VDVARGAGCESRGPFIVHVATKAELRDLVVSRWAEATLPPAAGPSQVGPARRPQRFTDG